MSKTVMKNTSAHFLLCLFGPSRIVQITLSAITVKGEPIERLHSNTRHKK